MALELGGVPQGDAAAEGGAPLGDAAPGGGAPLGDAAAEEDAPAGAAAPEGTDGGSGQVPTVAPDRGEDDRDWQALSLSRLRLSRRRRGETLDGGASAPPPPPKRRWLSAAWRAPPAAAENGQRNGLKLSSADSNYNYKTELCWYMNDPGGCRNGSSCFFAHSVDEIRSPGYHQADPDGDTCPFFLKGCCWYDSSCWMPHQTAADSNWKTRLCRDFTETGRCPSSGSGGSEACNFAHGQEDLRTPKMYEGAPGYKAILCTKFMLDDAVCREEFCFEAHGHLDLRTIPLAPPRELAGTNFLYSDSHVHLDHVLWTRRWGNQWFYKREKCRFRSCTYAKCLRAHEGELKPRLAIDRSDFASLAADLSSLGRFAGCVHSCCEAYAIDLAIDFVRWGRELLDGQVLVCFGIHPVSFETYTPEAEAALVAAMEECGPQGVAWGECGLDYYRRAGDIEEDPGVRVRMGECFAQQVRLAVKRGWPLVVHSRDAEADTFAILQENLPSDHPVYLHSFTGSTDFLPKFFSHWSRGFIGIAGCVTYHSAWALRDIAQATPLDRLLLETDGPYMCPDPYRGYIAHPGHIPWIAEGVAKARGDKLEDVLAASHANFCRFYQL